MPSKLSYGGSDALCTLRKIVTRVWKEEVVPEEWHQGIIIRLYKGKGSKSECSNYRGITVLSVPGKVFAHIILARIKLTLLSHRRPQQSGFMPARSTCDRIATLCNVAQRRQDFGHPTVTIKEGPLGVECTYNYASASCELLSQGGF